MKNEGKSGGSCVKSDSGKMTSYNREKRKYFEYKNEKRRTVGYWVSIGKWNVTMEKIEVIVEKRKKGLEGSYEWRIESCYWDWEYEFVCLWKERGLDLSYYGKMWG